MNPRRITHSGDDFGGSRRYNRRSFNPSECVMRKIVLTYGLIAGAILSVLMVATLPFLERIGFDRGAIIGYTTMVMASLMIYFGVRSYRDNVLGGRISFWRAFGTGMLITAV